MLWSLQSSTGRLQKDASSKSKKQNKAKKDDSSNPAVAAAKAILDKAQKAWDVAETNVEVVGAQIVQLYANSLYDKSRLSWEKIIKAQTETAPWVDLKG